MNLLQPLRKVKGIGEKREKLFGAKGIYSPQDLLFYFPKSFKDYSHVSRLADPKEVEALYSVQIKTKPSLAYFNKKMSLVRFKACDESADAKVSFFNMPYMAGNLKKGDKVYLYGKAKKEGEEITLTNPSVERNLESVEKFPFIPVYPRIFGISQRMIVKSIQNILNEIESEKDYLGEAFKKEFGFPDLFNAHKSIHFPDNMNEYNLAKKRFSLEELLVFLIILDDQVESKKYTDIRLEISESQRQALLKAIGFEMTNAQKRVAGEIEKDLMSGKVMNRLLQGDVGCGKTIIAFYAMFINYVNGYQSVLMAPTEVLAKQHYEHAKSFFELLGARVMTVTGADKKSERLQKLEEIKNGDVDIVFGTHALVYGEMEYKRLNLAITDEQHRFGVSQRAKISFNGKLNMLVMSATPIPRTLALVLYSKMDISVIDEMPRGRRSVNTHLIKDIKRKDMYEYIRKEIRKRRQAYVVCPLIEGEEDQKSVLNVSEELKRDFGFEKCVVLHGRMKPDEKNQIMKEFAKGEIDILVSTTVIEVGINVPNATVMVIEDAERFGLSTLHQLRGRVGRGEHQSYCFLVSETSLDRLSILCEETDGFRIAEKDLETRGPGQFLGYNQHGISDFYMSKMIKDMSLLELAKQILERMKKGEFEKEYNIAKKIAEKKYENMLKNIALN